MKMEEAYRIFRESMEAGRRCGRRPDRDRDRNGSSRNESGSSRRKGMLFTARLLHYEL